MKASPFTTGTLELRLLPSGRLCTTPSSFDCSEASISEDITVFADGRGLHNCDCGAGSCGERWSVRRGAKAVTTVSVDSSGASQIVASAMGISLLARFRSA